MRNNQDVFPIDAHILERLAEAVLDAHAAGGLEVSVLLVNDAEIQRLHQTHLGIDEPTDVLAFSQQEGELAPENSLLGDVVISIETAVREAADRQLPADQEVERYLVHGLLHLLGYDDQTSQDAKRMFREQERCLVELNVNRVTSDD